MVRIFMHLAHRHLVSAPVAFGALAVDFLRTGPAFRSPKHDHRPARPLRESVLARVSFDALNICDDFVQRGGHELVHLVRVVPFHEIGRVTVAAKEVIQLLMADAGEHGWIGDLVAVEMQDRQNRRRRSRD